MAAKIRFSEGKTGARNREKTNHLERMTLFKAENENHVT
jgi:hypothetical protein